MLHCLWCLHALKNIIGLHHTGCTDTIACLAVRFQWVGKMEFRWLGWVCWEAGHVMWHFKQAFNNIMAFVLQT